MLVFGVDVPLVEVIFAFAIIIFILLMEALVIILLLARQMHKTKEIGVLLSKLSEALLVLKKVELERLRGKK